MLRRACSRLSQKAAGQILKGHDSEVMCLAFAKSGRQLLSGSSDNSSAVCASRACASRVGVRVTDYHVGARLGTATCTATCRRVDRRHVAAVACRNSGPPDEVPKRKQCVAHRCHIGTGTGLAAATSAPGTGLTPRHRGWAHPATSVSGLDWAHPCLSALPLRRALHAARSMPAPRGLHVVCIPHIVVRHVACWT